MKLLLLSDIHAISRNPVGREDRIIDTFKEKFLFVLEYAKKHNCPILQAGDFFDNSRDWHILYMMIELLKKYGINLYSIFGQHDLLMRANQLDTPTTMGVLNRLGLIKILNKFPVSIGSIGNICLYGCSWDSKIPSPTPGKINILVIHASISNKAAYTGHSFTGVRYFLRKNKGWDLVLVGDIHIQSIYNNQKKRDTIVVNTGPMLRLVSSRYNMSHHPCFFIYDSNHHSLKKIEIPHKNSSEVLSRTHIKIKRREDISLSEESLVRFSNLMMKKQNKPVMTVRQLIWKVMKKRKTSKETKNLLMEITNREIA